MCRGLKYLTLMDCMLLQCDMTPAPKQVIPLGYKKAERSGPTTNFVGNHMTQVKLLKFCCMCLIAIFAFRSPCQFRLAHWLPQQALHVISASLNKVSSESVKCKLTSSALQGAIDLVQMELEELDPAKEIQKLRQYCKKFRPPERLPAIDDRHTNPEGFLKGQREDACTDAVAINRQARICG